MSDEPICSSDVICPHCNQENSPDDNWDFIDGDHEKVECEHCKKEFHVIVERPIEYTCSKEEI